MTPFPDREALLETALEAARAGGAELLARFRRLRPGDVTEKAANDLVSVADRAAEAAILGVIAARHPDHRVLAEESGGSGLEEPGTVWIVDPLDGTTNFVHGVPHWAVSVAVRVDGRLEAAVVADPLKGDEFTAVRGGGARWNGEPCQVSRRRGLAGALLSTGFPFKAHELLDRYLAIFREVFLRAKAVRRPGAAALDLAYVACGIFDGFFEFRLAPWDVAAGTLLVEEAGGAVTDMDGGGRHLECGDVVAGPPGVHRELLAAIRGSGASWLGGGGRLRP